MAQSRMTVVYAVLASSVLLLVFAALVWTRTLDLGLGDTMPLTALLVAGAVMDVAVA